MADAGTEMAVDRTLLAHERTLMAWVRTAASLISFGFTIYKFFSMELARTHEDHPLGYRTFSLLMIIIGLACLVLATIQQRSAMRKLKREYDIPGYSLSVVVAAMIGVLGICGLLAVLLRQ
jgi:putative membrane protein